MWQIVLVLEALLCISSITERPDSRKLVRHELCRLLTSVGVILKHGNIVTAHSLMPSRQDQENEDSLKASDQCKD